MVEVTHYVVYKLYYHKDKIKKLVEQAGKCSDGSEFGVIEALTLSFYNG